MLEQRTSLMGCCPHGLQLTAPQSPVFKIGVLPSSLPKIIGYNYLKCAVPAQEGPPDGLQEENGRLHSSLSMTFPARQKAPI